MKESYEKFFTPESKKFSLYIEEGKKEALEEIKEKFENPTEEKENLDFHNTRHTKDVIRRTKEILTKMREAEPPFISEEDIQLGKLAAAFHDTVQNWQENPVKEGRFSKTMRKRDTGENEKASAEMAKDFMEETNEKEKEEIFTDTDKEQLEQAIMATAPGWDPENKTVIQPNLKKESSYVSRALALADIGAAGMEGPEKFLEEGDALFREENIDLKDIAKNPAGLSADEKKYHQKRMVSWSYQQILFAQGRKALFRQETRDLPENMQKKLTSEIFTKFDKTIKGVVEKLRERKELSLEELLENFGYNK